MYQLSPENKANYLLNIFNNCKQSAINVCDSMMHTCLISNQIDYYNQVKQILKTK